MKKIKPRGKRLLVSRVSENDLSDGLIEIPDMVEQFQIGVEIVDIGDEVDAEKNPIGAQVLIMNYSLAVNATDFLITEDEILADILDVPGSEESDLEEDPEDSEDLDNEEIIELAS